MAFLRRETTTTYDRGTGLARGPAYIIGTILAAFGLIMLISGGDDPINFATAGFPDADVTSGEFIGFEWNGWTAWITITAGAFCSSARRSTRSPRDSASSSGSGSVQLR